jgi:hypothetical protein
MDRSLEEAQLAPHRGGRAKVTQFNHDTNVLANERLVNLAQATDTYALFCAVYMHLAYQYFDAERNWDDELAPVHLERLAFYLYPYLNKTARVVCSPQHLNEALQALDQLRDASMQSLVSGDEDRDGPLNDLMVHAKLEAELIRGSAFSEQTAEEIRGIQGRFEEQFRNLSGIGPNRALELIEAIAKTIEERMNQSHESVRKEAEEHGTRWAIIRRKKPKERNDEERGYYSMVGNKHNALGYGFFQALITLGVTLPVARTDLARMATPPSQEEWEALCQLIGFTTENHKGISEPLEIA